MQRDITGQTSPLSHGNTRTSPTVPKGKRQRACCASGERTSGDACHMEGRTRPDSAHLRGVRVVVPPQLSEGDEGLPIQVDSN